MLLSFGALFVLVFVLGLRHGLDADHLACIDGMVRHHVRAGHPLGRLVGTFFSFGHGLVVLIVAVMIGRVSQHYTFPVLWDRIASVVSVLMLFVVGTLNLVQLFRTRTERASYLPGGLKSKWMPRLFREGVHPAMTAVTGALFALAADTISQTSVWVLAAGHSGKQMPMLLGLTFMVGMMLTDTLDSLLLYRMLTHSGERSIRATRWMGWLIVLLAYGVSGAELWGYFQPAFDLDFEQVGLLVCVLFGVIWLLIRWRPTRKTIDRKQEWEV